jgi:hypothetical protein
VDVTKRWTRQRKAEEKDASARWRRADQMLHRHRLNQKEAAAKVLEAAYMKVSDNGQLPATARQIYYAARPLMLELTGKSTIDYNYFSQTLLIDFMAVIPSFAPIGMSFGMTAATSKRRTTVKESASGLLAFENTSAGTTTSKSAPLDTAASRSRHMVLTAALALFFFIEKEGFNDLLKSVSLADRFDIGIMSSKGNSVTAARQLADRICADRGIPLLTFHDFDTYGFTIGNIGEDTRRYKFENDIGVINIGLRLDDILELDGADLDALAEPCTVSGDKREALENSGATEDEIDFLLGEGEFDGDGARRIELNALTSRQLVDLIERRLAERGIGKIVPEADDLAKAFRAYARAPKIKEAVERAMEEMADEAVEVPADLDGQVRASRGAPRAPVGRGRSRDCRGWSRLSFGSGRASPASEAHCGASEKGKRNDRSFGSSNRSVHFHKRDRLVWDR